MLGDRPIELTLKRAWASMQPEERGVVVLAMASLLFGLRTKATAAAAAAAAGAAAGAPAGAAAGGGKEGGGAGAPLTLFSSPSATTSSSLPSSLAPSSVELKGYQGTNDELLETLQRFGSHFPSLYSSLIHERDRYVIPPSPSSLLSPFCSRRAR